MSTAPRRKKKKKQKKISFFQVLLLMLVVLIVFSAAIFFTDTFGMASLMSGMITASSVEYIDEDGIRQITGDYTIDQPGISLEETHISGNLYLGPGIGDGSVELIAVSVEGAVLVQGGGLNTITFRDCLLGEVKVNRPGGDVRLLAVGATIIENTIIETGARLLENPDSGFSGFLAIEVLTAAPVKLTGDFETIQVSVPRANLELESDKVNRLIVTRPAEGTAIKVQEGLQIDSLYLDGAAYLLGSCRVKQAYLSAPGVTELAGELDEVRVTAEAGLISFLPDSLIEKLIIEREALNNVLTVAKDVVIKVLELNEATEVMGEGSIESLSVNAAGSNLEPVPGEIVFGADLVVMIAGHEITTPDQLKALIEHGDPLYSASAANNQVENKPVSKPEPAPAPEPEPEPDPEPDPEPEPAPEPEPEPELEPEPDPVREFIVEEGLTPGKKLVIIALNVSEPQNYQVKVDGLLLGYNAEAQRFWGEVDAEKAERRFVTVTR